MSMSVPTTTTLGSAVEQPPSHPVVLAAVQRLAAPGPLSVQINPAQQV
jgi:hypothetical protein